MGCHEAVPFAEPRKLGGLQVWKQKEEYCLELVAAVKTASATWHVAAHATKSMYVQTEHLRNATLA